MIVVERTADQVIFRVPATWEDGVIQRIKEFIAVQQAGVAPPPGDSDDGIDEDGFVTDPVVLEVSKNAKAAGWNKLKDRFRGVEGFEHLFEER